MRIGVAGGAVIVIGLTLVGCGGSIGSSPSDAGTGIVLSPPPPFTIPAAPPPAAFEACEALSRAEPIGFLADGRAVVGQMVQQRVLASGRGVATLVRAWDPSRNTLERLFVASSAYPDQFPGEVLRISADGRRIVDAVGGQFRVYDVDRRGFMTDAPIPVAVQAVSDGGGFVLDADLRRYTVSGEADFDFKPLLPADLNYPAGGFPVGLSFAGDAVAVVAVDPSIQTWLVVVQYRDGRVVRLPDPNFPGCGGVCGMAWSNDGRHLLHYRGGSLHVWEVATAQLLAQLDDVSSAVFTPDGAHVVTGDSTGRRMTERDLSGAPTFTWPVEGDPRTSFGPLGQVLGRDSSGRLVTGSRLRLNAVWRQPSYGWPKALAVTSDAMFAIMLDWDRPHDSLHVPMMLARFVPGWPEPTAVFQPGESQSEWLGQLALSPDEQRIAVVFPDTVRVLDAATLAPLATFPAGAGMIAWSPDGRYIAASPDLHYRDPGRLAYLPAKDVTVWNAASGALAARFLTPVYPEAIAFDERGGTIVGWGRPLLMDMSHVSTIDSEPGSLHIYVREGEAAGFAIDLVTSTTSPTDLPAFVAATRGLVAGEDAIVGLATGTALSSIPAPRIRQGVFSPDFAALLAVDVEEVFPAGAGVRLLGVATGGAIATIPTAVSSYPIPALAVSRGGRRVAVNGDVFCAP